MKQCSRGIDGLRTGLSPSARPFPIASSSSFSITASKSDHEDSLWVDYNLLDFSFLSSDDQKSALGDDDSLSNLSRDVETTKEGQIVEDDIVLLNPNPHSSKSTEKLESSTAVTSEKSSTETDSEEEDSPCWIGILSRKNLSPGAKSVTSRRSTDDLTGFHKLNPLAPQFIPKKNLDMDEENNSSSSLQKSLSSNFPSSSSGEFSTTDPLKDDVLPPNADGNIVSKTLMTISDSRNESQPPKKLDPLAPVFVPSCAKLSPSLHEKQGAFEANANPVSALKVNVDTRSGVVSDKIRYSDGVRESKVRITENAKLGSSGNKPHGQRKLNPLAPQFSKPKDADYFSVEDADLPQSSVYMSRGSSTKWFASVEPKTTLSVKGDEYFKHPLPFHVVETGASSSSSGVKALSPKMDVKKLLTTMHGLSELLTHSHGSDSLNADEVDLINSTVQNLNLYIQNNIQLLPNKSKQLSIRDLQLPRANNMTVDLDVKRKEKYSETVPDSRLYQCDGVTNENGFGGQVVAQSGYQYQQNHYQGEEQTNQHALFYKSLWLKAEADRCLMVYETFLS